MVTVPFEIASALRRLALAPAAGDLFGEPIAGGVSSDVWRVELPSGPVCAKRALARLRVQADWQVPVERSRWEARWLAMAQSVAPGAACPLLGYDETYGVVVLGFLDPADFPLWKASLLAGDIDATVASALGTRLGRLHAGAARLGVAEWEPARPLFYALRIEPYLLATARRHPGLAATIDALAADLAGSAITVIHGDVSPKNVLVGPHGPVLLDAECASPGDPAFDVAFCANHLLLKAVLMPDRAEELLGAAGAFVAAYRQSVDWENSAGLERRAARLLPALALARVDGSSPVEYLTDDVGRPTVRAAAIDLLSRPPSTFDEVLERWATAVSTPAAP